MAEEKNPTPEKQLLKLIEEPGPGKSLKAAKIKHGGLSWLSFGAWTGRLSFLKVKAKGFFKAPDIRQLDIKMLNNFLALSIFALGSYFIISFSASAVNLKKMPTLDFKLGGTTGAKGFRELSALKEPAYYLDNVRQRDIFKMGAKATAEGVKIKTPSAKLMEATQNLRLVGISWSQDPDVMIEDTKNHITYFLKRGQSIENSVKIDAVFKDKVILSLGGEELELK